MISEVPAQEIAWQLGLEVYSPFPIIANVTSPVPYTQVSQNSAALNDTLTFHILIPFPILAHFQAWEKD